MPTFIFFGVEFVSEYEARADAFLFGPAASILTVENSSSAASVWTFTRGLFFIQHDLTVKDTSGLAER